MDSDVTLRITSNSFVAYVTVRIFLFLVRGGLRCVYTEYDEILRTYSDVGYETVRGYDVNLRHYPRHSRVQSLGALQNN